jgi:hypothetical protein
VSFADAEAYQLLGGNGIFAHLPKSVQTALGKKAASVAKKKKRKSRIMESADRPVSEDFVEGDASLQTLRL